MLRVTLVFRFGPNIRFRIKDLDQAEQYLLNESADFTLILNLITFLFCFPLPSPYQLNGLGDIIAFDIIQSFAVILWQNWVKYLLMIFDSTSYAVTFQL